MSSRNGNKWKTSVTHRDVLAIVEEIQDQYGLLVNFRVRYGTAVVVVLGTAAPPEATWEDKPDYVAKHSQSPLHAPSMETLMYRVAWDLYQQADAGARGFRGGASAK